MFFLKAYSKTSMKKLKIASVKHFNSIKIRFFLVMLKIYCNYNQNYLKPLFFATWRCQIDLL